MRTKMSMKTTAEKATRRPRGASGATGGGKCAGTGEEALVARPGGCTREEAELTPTVAEFRAVVHDLATSYQRGGMTPDAAKAKAFEEGFESALTGWADCIRRSMERDRVVTEYVKSCDKLRESWGKREELHARATAAGDKLLAIAETERDEARRALAQLKQGTKRKRRNRMYSDDAIAEFWSREDEWTGSNRGMQRSVAEEVMRKYGYPVEGKGRKDLVPNFIRAAQDRRRD